MVQRSYTVAYRADAVQFAKEMGARATAQQLKIPTCTLYTWIRRAKKGDLPMPLTPSEPMTLLNLTERVQELERENKALRSENVQIQKEKQMLEDTVAFFTAYWKK